jgi:hypothetical protein
VKSTVLTLLDQLEDLIASAPALPIGGRIIVARTQLLEFVDAMRVETLRPADDRLATGDGRGR